MPKPSALPTPRPPPTMIRASSMGAAAPASAIESTTLTVGSSVTPSTATISTSPAQPAGPAVALPRADPRTALRAGGLRGDARRADDDDAARPGEGGVRHELAAERAHLDA